MATSTSGLEAMLSQVSSFAKSASDAGRKQLIDGLRDLAISLEDDQDSFKRLFYCGYPLTALRIGCDIKLFNILQDAGKPLTVDDLAAKTSVAPILLGRLLRYMASVRLIKETGKDTFTGNNVTKTFTNPGFQGGVYHNHDYAQPGLQLLPDFLKKHNYEDVNNATDTPILQAWGATGMPIFAHYPTQPELFGHFQQFMAVQRLGMPTWLDVYPYKAQAESLSSPEQPFFVDVGGGFGHQTLAIRQALPKLPNKFILQDMAQTLAMPPTVKHPGIENVVQDFWTPQTITGAKIYYLRNVIHDYPDEEAVKILKLTKDALGPDSVILLDEMFLTDTGVHWQAAQIDITMMNGLAATERNESQWHTLVAKAGLRIRKVYLYTDVLRDAILECVPA